MEWKNSSDQQLNNAISTQLRTIAYIDRGGSRTAATSKMEHFVIIVNGFQPLTIITNCSILDVAGVLDPPLIDVWKK